MKQMVYLVSYGTGNFDGGWEEYLPVIMGVFSTEDKAKAAIKELELRNELKEDKFYSVYSHVMILDELADKEFSVTC